MSSDLYKQYEGEFVSCLSEIDDLILTTQANPQKCNPSQIEERIRYGERLLKIMITEINGLNISEARLKFELQQKLDRHKGSLGSLKDKWKSVQSNKENLIVFNNEHDVSQDRLLRNTKMLSDGVENLKYVKKTALEADSLGIEINRNLHKQTEQIQNNLNKLNDINDNLNVGSRLINEMNRRRITNKLILCLIGIVVLIGMGFVIYYEVED